MKINHGCEDPPYSVSIAEISRHFLTPTHLTSLVFSRRFRFLPSRISVVFLLLLAATAPLLAFYFAILRDTAIFFFFFAGDLPSSESRRRHRSRFPRRSSAIELLLLFGFVCVLFFWLPWHPRRIRPPNTASASLHLMDEGGEK